MIKRLRESSLLLVVTAMAHAGEMPSETRFNIGEPRDMMLDNALDDVAFPFQTVNRKLSPVAPSVYSGTLL